MTKVATPKKVAFVSKPYSQEERLKKDEEELKKLIKEQKGEKDAKEDSKDSTDADNTTDKADSKEPESAEERSFKKRYGDLRKHQQQQQKDFEQQISDLKRQLDETTKKEIKLPKTEEELESWAKEYPDVAAIVESIAIKKAKEQSKNLEDRMKEFEELRSVATKEKAEAQLLAIHPDFADIRESDDFHTWAEEQPKWVQDALYENDNDARSAARAIDLYKGDRGIGKKSKGKNDKGAAEAVAPKNKASRPQGDETSTYLRESEVQKMSPQQYEKQADEIMEAIRSGKFIYDVSGSAR